MWFNRYNEFGPFREMDCVYADIRSDIDRNTSVYQAFSGVSGKRLVFLNETMEVSHS